MEIAAQAIPRNLGVRVHEWCNIDRTHATTAYYRPGTLQFASDSGYDGSAQGKKTLIVFPWAVPSSQLCVLVLHSYINAAGGVTTPFPLVATATGAFTPSSTPFSFSVNAGATVRVRFIDAAYSLAGLTWNGFMATPPTMTRSVTFSFTGGARQHGLTGAITHTAKAEMQFATLPFTRNDGAVYGLVIDAQPAANVLPDSLGTISAQAVTGDLVLPVDMFGVSQLWALFK